MFAERPTRVPCPGHVVVPGFSSVGVGHPEHIVGVRGQLGTELPGQDDLSIPRISMAIGRSHQHRSR